MKAPAPDGALPLAIMLALTAPACAASPFDGKWVDDLNTQMGDQATDVYLVANGIYRCDSCSPARSHPADGKARPVPGDESSISEAVMVTGPRSIVTRTVGPDMVRETTMTVSADNRTATYVSLDRWPALRKRLRTEYLARRVAAGPSGAHPVSGSWLGVAYVAVPEKYRSIDLKETGDGLSRSNFRHGRYTARFGGPPAPLQLAGKISYSVVVRRADDRTRVETVLHEGRVVVERTYTLSADGRSMETAVRHPDDGTVFRTTSHRKSETARSDILPQRR